MALYERRVYDSRGKLLIVSPESLPSDYGFHKQNQLLDKRDGIRTRIYSKPTRSGLNRVVTGVYAVCPDGSKITYRKKRK